LWFYFKYKFCNYKPCVLKSNTHWAQANSVPGAEDGLNFSIFALTKFMLNNKINITLTQEQSMRKQFNIFLLMILLPGMALLPLQGVFASMSFESSQQVDHAQMITVQQNTSSDNASETIITDTQGCHQCAHHNCSESSCCKNGHCFSVSAIVTSSNLLKFNIPHLVASAPYQSALSLSQFSVLFRPPKI